MLIFELNLLRDIQRNSTIDYRTQNDLNGTDAMRLTNEEMGRKQESLKSRNKIIAKAELLAQSHGNADKISPNMASNLRSKVSKVRTSWYQESQI